MGNTMLRTALETLPDIRFKQQRVKSLDLISGVHRYSTADIVVPFLLASSGCRPEGWKRETLKLISGSVNEKARVMTFC